MYEFHGVQMEVSDDEKEALEIFNSARKFRRLPPDAIDGVIKLSNDVLARRYPDMNIRATVDKHGVIHVTAERK